MIGLSPPSAVHPNIFQHELVRPSAPRYRGFGLTADRSPGFGSAPRDSARSSHSLSLRLRRRLNLAAARQLAGSLCKRHAVTPEGAPAVWRRMISGSVSLPSEGFFSPFPHGTCALSVDGRYSALEGGPPGFGRSFTCSGLLRSPVGSAWGLRTRGCHPLRRHFPETCAGPAVPWPGPTTPGSTLPGLGLSAFARHYLRNLV